ncbi:DNA mismatch repair protein Msh6-like [Oopsacas minuta]|uniref:DNA mismatch repair protein Msh6-like n=1 Tax=Oopsacas minuta TaxID=111878 RepID=A0AAV7JQG8_9METZ|nr:DNA mismatch repair protein Msh6-like [Oopsacas minuta]
MGGKSTLIRQAGAIVILAQMGCYVPAKSCQLTPLTRIFSRLGASDRILAGESTFFVELSETASILRNADSHSLVLLDEFGRGTATFDGTAIASSVLDTLVSKVKCLTLFSTHYHSILDEARGWAGVQLGHMQCLVSEDDDKESESIIFLYKLAEGSCPKSYGFNVAKLAGINSEIISLAKKKADEMNRTAERLKALRKLARISQDIDPVES